ncbi:hypothetical protein BC567DRAFT_220065 [Phyllosticta citribraziliensis]
MDGRTDGRISRSIILLSIQPSPFWPFRFLLSLLLVFLNLMLFSQVSPRLLPSLLDYLCCPCRILSCMLVE